MSKERENIFVFVVCGDDEHIDTLNYSIPILRNKSKNKIIVVTDLKRNKKEINHEEVISIETPINYNNHQASIYLKTGLHKFLPKDNLYCYLDSDIIALNSSCDEIFSQYISPITFAKDSSLIESFSPYAVNCQCVEKYNSYVEKYNLLKEEFYEKQAKLLKGTLLKDEEVRDYFSIEIPKIIKNWNDTKQLSFFQKVNKQIRNPEKYFLKYSLLKKGILFFEPKYFFTFKLKRINVESLFDSVAYIKKNGGPDFVDVSGFNGVSCNHLNEEIKNVFNLDVQQNWNHWNGGVFVFDESSHSFLNYWHDWTLKMFENPMWKTRDQGTLIATVHHFKLENHPTLHPKWNCIIDVLGDNFLIDNEKIKLNYCEKQGFFEPVFAHYFHEFGNTNYDVWNWVIKKTKQ